MSILLIGQKEINMSILKKIATKFDVEKFKNIHETLTYSEYLERLYQRPKLARSAYQMLYDMVLSYGTSKLERYRKTYTTYNFFTQGEIQVFGLEESLDKFIKFLKGAAGFYGPEKRILLFHGPVGSSKSTICRALKRGLEKFSRTDEGAWYTYKWKNLPTGVDGIYTRSEDLSPMHDDPLRLIPEDIRKGILKDLNQILIDQTPEEKRKDLYPLHCEGDLNPRCRKFMEALLEKYEGNWEKVVEEHIEVVRMVYSEVDRVGIGTFQPKDEKNQDSTELTGDVNFAQLPHFGSDSDARAFNFDGEFNIANRGMIEFIEILKLEVAFLYDLLGASQEQAIKPKKFSQIPLDTVIISHTNDPEFQKLKENQSMEALRDRMVKIDIPYLLKMSDELKVLEFYYGPGKVKQHIAPHTLEIAALWAVLTRLQDDKENNISLVEKAMLYDGKSLPNWTEDRVKELRIKYPNEGLLFGVSCRYVQDKIANCLSSRYDYINPFMVLNELKDGLDHSSLITNKEQISRYNTCIDYAKTKLEDILKNEVQRALVGDEDAIIRLCTNYIDNVMAYIDGTKIKHHITGEDIEADEKLMRSIEEKIDIPDAKADDFRRQIAAFIGSMSNSGKKFTWNSNPRLEKALEKKLYEDVKDHIKLSALNVRGAAVVDPDIQEKIDAIKSRLIKQYGYNEQSATDVLDYVGSIFARGDVAED